MCNSTIRVLDIATDDANTVVVAITTMWIYKRRNKVSASTYVIGVKVARHFALVSGQSRQNHAQLYQVALGSTNVTRNSVSLKRLGFACENELACLLIIASVDNCCTGDFVVESDRCINRIATLHGLNQVDLAFDGIQLVLTKKGRRRDVLDGSIRGRARPGRMLAIMGPSGAGKSTVLHAIAGRIKDSSAKLTLHGTRYWNGIPLSEDSFVPTAFIAQDVSFFPYMTVRETLAFRVELKLGSNGCDAMVQDLLDQMGLTRAADTIVGDAKVRGISGGERKRLSIAVEMIGMCMYVCQ
jgi:ABC-type lipoprotein export system ATPase subunit